MGNSEPIWAPPHLSWARGLRQEPSPIHTLPLCLAGVWSPLSPHLPWGGPHGCTLAHTTCACAHELGVSSQGQGLPSCLCTPVAHLRLEGCRYGQREQAHGASGLPRPSLVARPFGELLRAPRGAARGRDLTFPRQGCTMVRPRPQGGAVHSVSNSGASAAPMSTCGRKARASLEGRLVSLGEGEHVQGSPRRGGVWPCVEVTPLSLPSCSYHT